jgi:hypothetical protein
MDAQGVRESVGTLCGVLAANLVALDAKECERAILTQRLTERTNSLHVVEPNVQRAHSTKDVARQVKALQ